MANQLTDLNIDPAKFAYHVDQIRELDQKYVDARMERAAAFKAAKADGINTTALSQVMKLAKESEEKTSNHYKHVAAYAEQFGITEQLDFFGQRPAMKITKIDHPEMPAEAHDATAPPEPSIAQ